MRNKSPKKQRDFFPKGIQYLRLPAEFGRLLMTLSSPEKDIYLYFMYQAMFKHSLYISASYEQICLGTGIKTRKTVSIGIQGLIEKGWIVGIQWRMNAPNVYHVSLSPKPNKDLIEEIREKSIKMSDAKKLSIANGEAGKFGNDDKSDG